MNIQSINSSIPQKSFRGILIDEGSKVDISGVNYDYGLEDNVGTSRQTRKYSYYPFCDETDAEIAKIVKKNKSHREYKVGLVDYIRETIVEVKKALPFNANEYNAFMKENIASDFDLIRFIKIFELLGKK